jgi:hypothetical protein
MVFKLPIVKAKEYSFVSIYSITSLILMAITVYLFIAGPASWPIFMKNWPSLLTNILFACLFLNGGFALLRPSLAKPENVGTLIIDDVNKKVIIEEDLKNIELPFDEINRIDFEIKGYKNLMDNLHGNNNFVEFTFNLFMSKVSFEFVIDTAGEMYTIKNAFKKISKANPKVEISYYS